MGNNKTVLIIDDSAFIFKILKKMFENNGFEVVGYAESGYKGLEMYKELKPDLVSLDITMPDLDGVETLRKIRKIDAKAKVIILSATDYADVRKELVDLGVVHFIMKPFEEAEIISAAQALTTAL
ncbi:MAG: response regulator [Syntrophomonadaceae bacterium]|nr:response regulator [Syntrophomonadaceae bacterium]